jgi:serine protease inhibitor
MGGIAQAAQADAAFGTDLYRELAAVGGNVVFSPASVAASLRMALVGARGDTAAELASVLHLPGPEGAADGLRDLAGIRPGEDLEFRAPNTLWVESAAAVREEFLEQLDAAVSVRLCDFAAEPEASRQAINRAIAEQTAGKITDLLPSGVIGRDTRLVLANAVYLNALWAYQFPAHQTQKKPFYAERSVASPTDMMRLEARLAYQRGDGYQAVLLPYRGGSLAMAVVLPDGPLGELAMRLDDLGGVGGLLLGLLSADAEHQVDLSLPRFRINSGFMLRDTLAALGVRLAFGDAADFSGIAPERLAISQVVHRAYIDVGEKGTEAAAATGTVMRALAAVRKPSPEIMFAVDRPFLFMIADTDSGLPLFVGQLTRVA